MKKILLSILLIIIVIFIAGFKLIQYKMGDKSSTDIKNYLNTGEKMLDTNAKDVMPKLNELPKYKSISYKYNHKSILFFESDAVTLVLTYDDKTYKREKDKLTKTYTFLNKKIEFSDMDDDEYKYIIPEYEFSINTYNFKVVGEEGKGNTEFPKSFGIIGTSDKKKSIAYLYFYDFDLDCIGKKNDKNPMENFVKDYFNYDF